MARKRNQNPPPAKRAIVPDFELWAEVTRTVSPLESKTGMPSLTVPEVPGPLPLAKMPKQKPAALPVVRKAQPPTAPNRPTHTPALTGLDRRTSQRLTRGKIDIDARIDLHGETGETARVQLRSFLSQARASGSRTVLVITGKGTSQFARHTLHGSQHFHAPERLGRLRRLVTQWFDEPEFRQLVSGYQPAHPRHGGGGAFYVRLRRTDKAG